MQFFIVHDDHIGRELKEALLAKAREGVRVLFLYDEIGSHALPERYLRELRKAGALAHAFITSRDMKTRLQVNFRNHRKIVVVDGLEAFVGGHNVGDEYLGRSKRFGHWRDTHLAVSGPAARGIQLSFLDDWHWSTGLLPELDWSPPARRDGGTAVMVLPTGPADALDTCALAFAHAIQSARVRIWITSPYFVPDQSIVVSLLLAVMRGVDVRIMIPAKADHRLAWLAAFSYFKDTIPFGVKLYRYQDGFLHQKVMLVDDYLSSIGTANLDTRSLRLHFEISFWIADQGFAAEVERMLEEDFSRCRLVTMSEIDGRALAFKVAVRLARLLAPVL